MMLKTRIITLFIFIFQCIGIIFFVLGFPSQNTLWMDTGILFLWIGNICYGLESFNERIFFLAFQATFFTFLLGRTVSNIILNKDDIYNFSTEIVMHTKLCLFIALLSLYIVYWLAENVRFKSRYSKNNSIKILENECEEIDYNSTKYKAIRYVSKTAFFATYVFDILVVVEKTIFVQAMGYAEYYVSYTSSFPYYIVKLGDACQVFFYIFLATMPSKKEIKIPLIMYILEAIISLGAGKRQDFVVPLLLVILYFSIRNHINSGGTKWLTKWLIRMCIIMLPFLLVILFTFNTIRFGGTSSDFRSDYNTVEEIAGFFDNTGFSVNVISYEKYYENIIPDKLYSFGDTIDYLRENVLTQLFFDFPVYKTQTAEKAIYGNNFSQTITYIRSSSYYLSGRGYGSCYIAEAYHDFGYLGIVFWSAIYSVVLYFVYNFKNKGVIYITLALNALHYILIAPRNMASAFITEYINVNTWLVILCVLVTANFLQKGSGGNRLEFREQN